MNSRGRRDFDEWIRANYAELVRIAQSIHPDGKDLVHHTYLKVVKSIHKGSVIKNLPAYFNRAMFIARIDEFGKLYFRADFPQKELHSTSSLDIKIREDEALLLANHLPWFDRTILELYLEGYSMAEISRESGISADVLYKSISTSKKILRNVVGERTKTKR